MDKLKVGQRAFLEVEVVSIDSVDRNDPQPILVKFTGNHAHYEIDQLFVAEGAMKTVDDIKRSFKCSDCGEDNSHSFCPVRDEAYG